MRGDVVELLPAKGTDAAIIVRLNLESRWSEGQRREFRNRPGRQQRDHHALSSNVQAGEAGRSSEKNVRVGGQFRLAQDHLALGKVGDLQGGYKVRFVRVGK